MRDDEDEEGDGIEDADADGETEALGEGLFELVVTGDEVGGGCVQLSWVDGVEAGDEWCCSFLQGFGVVDNGVAVVDGLLHCQE